MYASGLSKNSLVGLHTRLILCNFDLAISDKCSLMGFVTCVLEVCVMSKFFSIPGGILITIALCVAVGHHFHSGTMLWIAVGLFCFGKTAIAMSFAQGYGVKKGVTVIAGMPLLLAVGVVIVAFIIYRWIKIAYEPTPFLPATVANLRSFGWSAAAGLGVALCHWYLYARTRYFHESEYNIRVLCKNQGKTDEETEAVVADYRAQGIIRP